MSTLTTAFAGEGVTDYEFFVPLLERHVEQLLIERGRGKVRSAAPLWVVDEEKGKGNQADTVAALFRDGKIWSDVLFVHTDGGSDPARARRERVEPLRDLLDAVPEAPQVVGVVPLRETEAWLLADPSAIGQVLGHSRPVVVSHPPKHTAKILDPKAELHSILSSRRSNRRRRQHESIYASLGKEIQLSSLRTVPSFIEYEKELVAALASVGMIA